MEMRAFQTTMQSFVHNTKSVGYANSNNANLKSNISTKPCTLDEEKEPMPSFLKAINIYSTELNEEDEYEIFDEQFSV